MLELAAQSEQNPRAKDNAHTAQAHHENNIGNVTTHDLHT
jgi:hypothetical protein